MKAQVREMRYTVKEKKENADFLDFIQRYRPKLRSLAAKLETQTNGMLDREDVEQDLVIAAWRGLETYDASMNSPTSYFWSRVHWKASHLLGYCFKSKRNAAKLSSLEHMSSSFFEEAPFEYFIAALQDNSCPEECYAAKELYTSAVEKARSSQGPIAKAILGFLGEDEDFLSFARLSDTPMYKSFMLYYNLDLRGYSLAKTILQRWLTP